MESTREGLVVDIKDPNLGLRNVTLLRGLVDRVEQVWLGNDEFGPRSRQVVRQLKGRI